MGGSDYKKHSRLELYLGKNELSDIYNKFKKMAKLIVFKIPKNYDFTNFISDKEPIQVTCLIHKYTFNINIKLHLKYGGCKYCNLDYNFNNFQEKSNLKFNQKITNDRTNF